MKSKGNRGFPIFPSLLVPVPHLSAGRCWHLRKQDREPEGCPAEASEREEGAALECLGGWHIERINKHVKDDVNPWKSDFSLSEGI